MMISNLSNLMTYAAAPNTQPVPDALALPPSVAMDVLQRARQQPECVRAQQSLAEARKQLSAVESQQVDVQACISRSVSEWGLFALCGSLFGSMVLLSKSGLTGTGALVGLAVGFVGVPALAMWLVKKNGEADAKGQIDALEQQRKQWAAEVPRRQAIFDGSVQNAAVRLFQEEQTHLKESAPDPTATVSSTDTTVQLGKIKVVRKGAEAEAAKPAAG